MNPGEQGVDQAIGRLPVTTTASAGSSFEAFYRQYVGVWVRYAEAQTGSREAAELIADGITAHMEMYWNHVPRPESAARHAWKVLKPTVAHWLELHETGSAFVETASFDRVTSVSRVLARQREAFAEMEESMGLFSAISRLPERQYDSVVLHFVLGYPYSKVACLLGVPEGTVRVNICHAKKRLSKELGRTYLIETEA